MGAWLNAVAVVGMVAIVMLVLIVLSAYLPNPASNALINALHLRQVEVVTKTVYVNNTVVKYINQTVPVYINRTVYVYQTVSQCMGGICFGDAVLNVYPNGTAILMVPVTVTPFAKALLSQNATWQVKGPAIPYVLEYGNPSLGIDIDSLSFIIYSPSNYTALWVRSIWLCQGQYWPLPRTGLHWDTDYWYFLNYFYSNITGNAAYLLGYPNYQTSIKVASDTYFLNTAYRVVNGELCYTNPIGPLYNGTTYPITLEVSLLTPLSYATWAEYSWYWFITTNMTVIIHG